MLNKIPDSEIKNIEDFLIPISKDNPCGPYLKRDPAISLLKELRTIKQDIQPGMWAKKTKQVDTVSESIQTAETFLKTTSKDLLVATYYTEALIKKYGFFGLNMGLSVMNALCETYWNSLNPGLNTAEAPLRLTAFNALHNILTEQLNITPIVTTSDNQVFCPFDVLKTEKGHQPKKIKNKIISILVQENANDLTFYKGILQNSIKILKELNVRFKELNILLKIDEEPLNFSKQIEILNLVLELVEAAVNSDRTSVQNIDTNEGVQMASDSNNTPTGGIKTDLSLLNESLKSIYDAYEMIDKINEYLLKNDTHSPCPYLIKRATEWRKKNVFALYSDIFASISRPDELFALLAIRPPAAPQTSNTGLPPAGSPPGTPIGGGYPPTTPQAGGGYPGGYPGGGGYGNPYGGGGGGGNEFG